MARKGLTDDEVNAEALRILGLAQVLPRLVVFDLDYTLWPFYCECRSSRDNPSLYPHANGILRALQEKGVQMAIASRSPTPAIAKAFLNKLGIASLFSAVEIFPSWTHKTQHFQGIHRKTGVPFNSMLFFDDEDRNIDSISKMGATSIWLGNGINLEAFKSGLTSFARSFNMQNSSRNNKS